MSPRDALFRIGFRERFSIFLLVSRFVSVEVRSLRLAPLPKRCASSNSKSVKTDAEQQRQFRSAVFWRQSFCTLNCPHLPTFRPSLRSSSCHSAPLNTMMKKAVGLLFRNTFIRSFPNSPPSRGTAQSSPSAQTRLFSDGSGAGSSQVRCGTCLHSFPLGSGHSLRTGQRRVISVVGRD